MVLMVSGGADSTALLVLAATSELDIDDVNVRVREALIAAGIEIPYNSVNVVDAGKKD